MENKKKVRYILSDLSNIKTEIHKRGGVGNLLINGSTKQEKLPLYKYKYKK